MKKSLFAMLAAAVLAVACTENSKVTVDPKLTVDGLTLNDNHGVNVEAAASTVDFTVKANVAYTIVSDQEWATPAPAKVENADNKEISTEVKVNVEANTAETRSAKISIVVDGHNELNYEFTISQAAAVHEKTLKVLDKDLNEVTEAIPADGETASTITLNVVSTVSWTAAPEQEWITVTPASATAENYEQTSTTVKLDIAVNDKKEARSAKVTFTGEGIEPVEITVNQGENIPFTAVIEAMTVSEFNENLVAQYPEETSIAVYIGEATAEVVSGYYGLWNATVWASIIADWDNSIDEAVSTLVQYGTAMSDQVLGNINDPNRGYMGTIFYNLQSDTEYTLVAMVQDAKGRTYINHSTAKTKAEAPIEYDGFLKIGKYNMTYIDSDKNTSATVMNVRYAGEENKYTVQDPAIDDGSVWHAEYDPTAMTLTLNGIEKGYESDGNMWGFGVLYGYWNKTQKLGYGYLSFTEDMEEEDGDQPCVFTVNENGYLSGLKNLAFGAFVYQMDDALENLTKALGWGAIFMGEGTVIAPQTSTSAVSSKFEMVSKEADLSSRSAMKTRVSGLKMVNKLYK